MPRRASLSFFFENFYFGDIQEIFSQELFYELDDDGFGGVFGLSVNIFFIIYPYMGQFRGHEDEVAFIEIAYVVAYHSAACALDNQYQLIFRMEVPGVGEEDAFFFKYNE